MKNRINKTFFVASFLILTSLLVGGCSPFYVVRAAYEQSKILMSREKIEELVSNPETPADEREKLQLVLDARQFGIDLGLNPKRAFTQYARIDGDAVAWVISAAPKDKFELYTWWFPFVGSIPYKGFFEKRDALEEAKELEREGYETWVRGTEAFSTLGWFNDPLLSTTLKNDAAHVANTVLHESLHSTVWVPNHVEFNESLANFVGFEASTEFFRKRLQGCASLAEGAEHDRCTTREQEFLSRAERAMTRELAISDAIEVAYTRLKVLYESDVSRQEKLGKREVIFQEVISPLRSEYPDMRILKSVNNAEILQLQLYLMHLRQFRAHFERANHSWKVFLSDIEDIRDQISKDASLDPFKLIS